MKKFVLLLAIGGLASCGEHASTLEHEVDSSKAEVIDSMKTAKTIDSLNAGADSLNTK